MLYLNFTAHLLKCGVGTQAVGMEIHDLDGLLEVAWGGGRQAYSTNNPTPTSIISQFLI